jgi:hypothetical protein
MGLCKRIIFFIFVLHQLKKMKKIFLFSFVLVCLIHSANAQKPKNIAGTTITPNSGVAKLLPDLTFSLIPVISGGGNGYEPVAGISGRIKMPIRFIVKNIGNATSKPCKVEIELYYTGQLTAGEARQSAEGNGGPTSFNRITRSEICEIQAIEKGKDVLRNHAFVFTKFPEEAFGKRVKIIAHILYPDNNGEISKVNNYSEAYEFDLVK